MEIKPDGAYKYNAMFCNRHKVPIRLNRANTADTVWTLNIETYPSNTEYQDKLIRKVFFQQSTQSQQLVFTIVSFLFVLYQTTNSAELSM